jgi:hypothetical protein
MRKEYDTGRWHNDMITTVALDIILTSCCPVIVLTLVTIVTVVILDTISIFITTVLMFTKVTKWCSGLETKQIRTLHCCSFYYRWLPRCEKSSSVFHLKSQIWRIRHSCHAMLMFANLLHKNTSREKCAVMFFKTRHLRLTLLE